MDVRILRAGPEHAELVRATRLRSLADTPDAFWTTEAEARAEPQDIWRERLAAPDGATFVAVPAGRSGGDGLPRKRVTPSWEVGLGLAFGRPHHDLAGEAGLYGMWVAPEARGRGVGGRLIREVVAWARGAGHPRLLLEVGDANAPAIAAYRALGFVPTGREGTMPPPREHITEHELALDLRRPMPPLDGPSAYGS